MAYRLGVDVGGTFTDVLLIDTDSGHTWRGKTASTPADRVASRCPVRPRPDCTSSAIISAPCSSQIRRTAAR